MKRVNWVFPAFAVIGAGLFAGGVFLMRAKQRFLDRAETAPGVFIENVWKSGSSRNSTGSYFPRVRFRTAGGNEVTFDSGTGSSPPSYRPNQEVSVVYDPADPSRASINSFWDLWLGPVILYGLGGVWSEPVRSYGCAGGHI